FVNLKHAWFELSRNRRGGNSVRNADIHVSQLSREKRMLPTGATEERARTSIFRTAARKVCLSAMVPTVSQNRTSICCLRPGGPSQKIEFVFAASPETIRREPREFDLLCSVGNLRD